MQKHNKNINQIVNLSSTQSPILTNPSTPTNFPFPSLFPPFHLPSKTSPFPYRKIPFPCNSSFTNEPSYTSPLANLRIPIPCFIPLLQSPQYSAPERKQYRPQPWISSSSKSPVYFQPLEQEQVPHPYFFKSTHYPQQVSPLLQIIFVRPEGSTSRDIYVRPYSSLFVVPYSIIYCYCSYSWGSGYGAVILGLYSRYYFSSLTSVTRNAYYSAYFPFYCQIDFTSLLISFSLPLSFLVAQTLSSPSFRKYSSANS